MLATAASRSRRTKTDRAPRTRGRPARGGSPLPSRSERSSRRLAIVRRRVLDPKHSRGLVKWLAKVLAETHDGEDDVAAVRESKASRFTSA